MAQQSSSRRSILLRAAAVECLVKHLQQQPEVEIAVCLLEALQALLLESTKAQDAFRASRGVRALVAALRIHALPQQAVEGCLAMLTSTVRTHPADFLQEFKQADGMTALVALLQPPGGNDHVEPERGPVVAFLRALVDLEGRARCLAVGKVSQDALAIVAAVVAPGPDQDCQDALSFASALQDAGAFAHVLKLAVGSLTKLVTIQALGALRHLAASGTANLIALADAGAVSVLVKTLERAPADSEAAEAALAALRHFVDWSEAARMTIRDLGGIKALLRSMEKAAMADTVTARRTSEMLRLLASGPSDNTSMVGKTVLHWASQFGEDKLLRDLLEAGADIGCIDSLGNTALHLAALNGHTVAVKMLIMRNSDALLANHDGKLPRDLAQHASHAWVMLGDEMHWREYLHVLRPCHVSFGPDQADAEGRSGSGGALSCNFCPLEGVMCLLEDGGAGASDKEPGKKSWLKKLIPKAKAKAVEQQAIKLPHSACIVEVDDMSVEINLQTGDDVLGTGPAEGPSLPFQQATISLCSAADLRPSLELMVKRAYPDLFKLRGLLREYRGLAAAQQKAIDGVKGSLDQLTCNLVSMTARLEALAPLDTESAEEERQQLCQLASQLVGQIEGAENEVTASKKLLASKQKRLLSTAEAAVARATQSSDGSLAQLHHLHTLQLYWEAAIQAVEEGPLVTVGPQATAAGRQRLASVLDKSVTSQRTYEEDVYGQLAEDSMAQLPASPLLRTLPDPSLESASELAYAQVSSASATATDNHRTPVRQSAGSATPTDHNGTPSGRSTDRSHVSDGSSIQQRMDSMCNEGDILGAISMLKAEAKQQVKLASPRGDNMTPSASPRLPATAEEGSQDGSRDVQQEGPDVAHQLKELGRQMGDWAARLIHTTIARSAEVTEQAVLQMPRGAEPEAIVRSTMAALETLTASAKQQCDELMETLVARAAAATATALVEQMDCSDTSSVGSDIPAASPARLRSSPLRMEFSPSHSAHATAAAQAIPRKFEYGEVTPRNDAAAISEDSAVLGSPNRDILIAAVAAAEQGTQAALPEALRPASKAGQDDMLETPDAAALIAESQRCFKADIVTGEAASGTPSAEQGCFQAGSGSGKAASRKCSDGGSAGMGKTAAPKPSAQPSMTASSKDPLERMRANVARLRQATQSINSHTARRVAGSRADAGGGADARFNKALLSTAAAAAKLGARAGSGKAHSGGVLAVAQRKPSMSSTPRATQAGARQSMLANKDRRSVAGCPSTGTSFTSQDGGSAQSDEVSGQRLWK
ncbi:hypothetical protein WJX72_002563 [[Myrmecia] bisecta]|uniref:Uncharacterized protein n=1 Tax=[Myrmecia] bisecta TaxID=41462 RepID=A0AAW1P3A6_9CHLO